MESQLVSSSCVADLGRQGPRMVPLDHCYIYRYTGVCVCIRVRLINACVFKKRTKENNIRGGKTIITEKKQWEIVMILEDFGRFCYYTGNCLRVCLCVGRENKLDKEGTTERRRDLIRHQEVTDGLVLTCVRC